MSEVRELLPVPDNLEQVVGAGQEASDHKLRIDVPIAPIVKAVEGLVASNQKSMGSVTASQLVLGSLRQINADLHDARKELRDTQRRFEDTNSELTACRIKTAVLEGKIQAIVRYRWHQNIAYTFGAALIGLAVDFFRREMPEITALLGALGLIMIIYGWLPEKNVGEGK